MNKDFDSEPYDPVFLHARKEAWVIFRVWLVAMLWAVPFCYYTGYVDEFDPDSFSTTLGIPTWLFWGIGVPWLVADVVTTWFCLFAMKDDDLGEAPEEAATADGPSGKEAAS